MLRILVRALQWSVPVMNKHLQVHPDANPTRPAWANEMMKALNAAYDRVIKEKSQNQK